MKLLIIGHARHGKDTVCEILSSLYQLRFTSSSLFCAEKVIFPKMQDIYANVEDCFNDRHSNRGKWHELISEYNTPDKTRLTREILEHHDIYCGMRCDLEFSASKHLFDHVVWVDASERLPPEPYESMKLTKDMADYVLNNNEGKAFLKNQIRRMMEKFYNE